MRNKELKMKLNIQFFARKKDNIKALNETRAEKVRELEELYEKLQEENRAVTGRGGRGNRSHPGRDRSDRQDDQDSGRDQEEIGGYKQGKRGCRSRREEGRRNGRDRAESEK